MKITILNKIIVYECDRISYNRKTKLIVSSKAYSLINTFIIPLPSYEIR